jgi:phage tail-like protein
VSQSSDPGSTIFYTLSVDTLDIVIGGFNTCEGFNVEAPAEQYEEGGNNSFTWHLPSRLNFSHIQLSRPIDGNSGDSGPIQLWLMTSQLTTFVRPGASLSALRPDGSEVCSWGLNECTPVSWQGPHFDSSNPGVAIETLEIAYHGFSGI